MHTVELWRWRLTDPTTGRSHRSRHVMTEADALVIDPQGQRVDQVSEAAAITGCSSGSS